jgi:exodeoxyribonuclease-3
VSVTGNDNDAGTSTRLTAVHRLRRAVIRIGVHSTVGAVARWGTVPTDTPLTIASVNVNGLRAANTNGMGSWWQHFRPDVVTMQEVRAPNEIVHPLVCELADDPDVHVAHAESGAKGRAGVAIASRHPLLRVDRGLEGEFDGTGRWIEVLLDTSDDHGLVVVSAYVHTGDAESPQRMAEKLAFLTAMGDRMETLRAAGHHVVVTGDLNVGHRELDIKNWKGNRGKAGFLPEERAWFDRMLGLGWVDVGRLAAGDVAGPYTWWSWRGKAFDIDSGWRIDYHIATPELAATATEVIVDRAPTYAERWSDHAPVRATYRV